MDWRERGNSVYFGANKELRRNCLWNVGRAAPRPLLDSAWSITILMCAGKTATLNHFISAESLIPSAWSPRRVVDWWTLQTLLSVAVENSTDFHVCKRLTTLKQAKSNKTPGNARCEKENWKIVSSCGSRMDKPHREDAFSAYTPLFIHAGCFPYGEHADFYGAH